MSRTFKIVLVLLVLASVVSAALAVFAFIAKEKEYMRRLMIEDKLAATLKDKRRVERELEVKIREAREAEEKSKDLMQKIDELTAQIKEEKDKYKIVTEDLHSKKEEIKSLKQALEKERKEKLTISRKLDDLEFDYERIKKEVARLKNERIRLEKDLADLKEKSVELDKIVVKPNEQEGPAPELLEPVRQPLRGRVLVVNREYSFVVTDLGEDDGVEKGMIFEIRDGTEFLGRVEIDKVYETMSSATVLPGGNINYIKKGNLVIESR